MSLPRLSLILSLVRTDEHNKAEEGLEAPVPLRLPKVHRAPDEFDELPHELPDGSVGWTTNPERSRE